MSVEEEGFLNLPHFQLVKEMQGTRIGRFAAVTAKAALANPVTHQDGDGFFLKVGKLVRPCDSFDSSVIANDTTSVRAAQSW